MITYEVNRAELELVEKKLGDMKSKAPQVFKNAVNKTARQARKRIAQSAQGAYTVKQVGFNRHMKIKNASTGNLTASVDADGKPLEITRFSNRAGSHKKGGAAASADIVKSGMKQLISSQGGKAFKAGVQTGHAGTTHNGIFQRKGKSRLPIKQLYSNSVPKMVEKVYQGERGMAGALKEPIQSDLRKNLEAEIKKIVG